MYVNSLSQYTFTF